MKTIGLRAIASALMLSVAFWPADAQVRGGNKGGGSSVSVTSASPNIIVSPTPGTGTFTIGTTVVLRAVTLTTDTILSSDAGKLVTYNNASAVAVTLPQATGSFATGFSFTVQNRGAGTVTITPTTSTINGAATLTVAQNMGCDITSDGTNWQVSSCTALASGGAGTPGGSNTQLQYNNSGAFGGVAGATWNGTTFTLPNLTMSGNIDLSGAADRNILMNATSEIDVGGSPKLSFTGGSTFFSGFWAGSVTGGAGIYGGLGSTTVPTIQPNWSQAGTTGLWATAGNILVSIANSTDMVHVATTGMSMTAGVFTLKGFTVATLPASPATGSEAYVTDANAACTYGGTATGGGSTVCKMFYTGAAWKEN